MHQQTVRVSVEVIDEAKAGSARAFGVIVDEYQTFAYRVAFRFVGHAAEAEDIVQEGFISLWKNIHQYRTNIKITTWLYRIIANRSLDFLKSSAAKQRKNHMDMELGYFIEQETTPLSELEGKELLNVIQQAADTLTPKQRAVFVLRDLEGLTVDEVCDVLSISSSNMKSNLYHARQAVSKRLKPYIENDNSIRL
jgi:RNA polymerase sigma-70 factor (ECF subfamily)